MTSEARLYNFAAATQEQLRRFRLSTSRAPRPQAVIYLVDTHSYDVRPDDDGQVYSSMDELADALPDNAPRFILLSHPVTSSSGRHAVPYVLLSYMPATSKTELRMLYAGVRERLRAEAGVGRVLEVESAEEVENVATTLASSA